MEQTCLIMVSKAWYLLNLIFKFLDESQLEMRDLVTFKNGATYEG